MYTVRPYEIKDYEMIDLWWKSYQEMGPDQASIPLESSFICMQDNTPVLMLTVYLTNCKNVCYLENFIGNPYSRSADRRPASDFFLQYIYAYLKDLGYKHALCFSMNEKLTQRYQELGMTKTITNLTAFGKVIF